MCDRGDCIAAIGAVHRDGSRHNRSSSMNLPSDIGYDSSSGAGVRWPWLLGVDVIDDSVGPKDMHEVTSDGVIHRLGAELRVDCVGYHVSKMTLLTLSSAKTATFQAACQVRKMRFRRFIGPRIGFCAPIPCHVLDGHRGLDFKNRITCACQPPMGPRRPLWGRCGMALV